MTNVEELRKLPVQWRKIIKKLENTKLKLAKANWSTQFNYVCLKENLMPNYTTIIICALWLSNRVTTGFIFLSFQNGYKIF